MLFAAVTSLADGLSLETLLTLKVEKVSNLLSGCTETNISIREKQSILYRIAGVLDFIHRPDFTSYKKKEESKRRFGNWICFRPQVRGDTYSVGSLRKS
jgi:hypothetical protein